MSVSTQTLAHLQKMSLQIPRQGSWYCKGSRPRHTGWMIHSGLKLLVAKTRTKKTTHNSTSLLRATMLIGMT